MICVEEKIVLLVLIVVQLKLVISANLLHRLGYNNNLEYKENNQTNKSEKVLDIPNKPRPELTNNRTMNTQEQKKEQANVSDINSSELTAESEKILPVFRQLLPLTVSTPALMKPGLVTVKKYGTDSYFAHEYCLEQATCTILHWSPLLEDTDDADDAD